MEKVVFISIPKDELESLIINCVNACLKYHKPVSSQSYPSDKKFTIDELEAYTGIKKNTLYGMVSRGEIPVSKPGRQLIFIKSKIDQWLEDHRKKTTAEIAAAADQFLVSKRKNKNG